MIVKGIGLVKNTGIVIRKGIVKGKGILKLRLGPELVTNGNFDTDSDWILTTNWSISGGKLRAVQDVVGGARQENVSTTGKTYLVEIKVDVNTPSGLSVSLGTTGNRIPIITTAGIHSGILTADGARLSINPQFDFQLNTEIDYISVREIL